MSDPGETRLSEIDHVRDTLDRLRLDVEARERGAVVVEGPSDAAVLRAAVSEDLYYFPVGGRTNLLRIADRLDADYLRGVICVADLDFDDASIDRAEQWFLVFTDDADVEAMLYWSPALERVLAEWVTETKYQAYGGVAALRNAVEEAVSAIAALRSWSVTAGVALPFDTVDWHKAIDKTSLKFNLIGLVDRLTATSDVPRSDVQEALGFDPPICPYTKRLKARGRDRLVVVTMALRSLIGSLSKQQASSGLVEKSLRLAVRPADIVGTSFHARFEVALGSALAA